MSLQVELKLHLNQDLIRNVKLFNLGSPEFILETVKYLYPKICMKGDIVIWYGEIADEMYFIKKGKVQIITECHSRVIAIQEEGSYFGEIGLLLTGKRTCIVQAIENCIFMCLKKENFIQIMAQFPDQRNHLLKVSKQRLQTTKATDLPLDRIIEKQEFREDDKDQYPPISVFNLFLSSNSSNLIDLKQQKSTTPKNKMIQNGQFQSMIATLDNDSKQIREDISLQQNKDKNNQMTHNSDPIQNTNINHQKNKDKSTFYNQFKQNLQPNLLKKPTLLKKTFLLPSITSLRPFSLLGNKGSRFLKVWNFIIGIVVAYNFFFVPLSIAYSIDLEGKYASFEYLNYIIYFLDMIVYSYTVQFDEDNNYNQYRYLKQNNNNNLDPSKIDHIQTSQNTKSNNKNINKSFPMNQQSLGQSNLELSQKQSVSIKEKLFCLKCINPRKVVDYYFKRILFIFDIFSTLPIDIILSFLNVNLFFCRFTRVLRLTRAIRLTKLYKPLNHKFQWNKGYLYLKMFFIILYTNHIIACIIFLVAENELGRNEPNIFSNFAKNYIPSRIPLQNQNRWEIYFTFLYYSLNCTSQGSFGTIQAVTLGEKWIQSLVILAFRVLTIFFIAKALNSEKMGKTLTNEAKSKMESIRIFLRYKNFPKNIMNRIYKFYDYSYIKFKGLEDQEILDELPNTVQNEIILSLFQNVLKKISTNDSKDQGVVLTLMKMMKQKIVPKDEYVFKKGEIAAEMYFIIEGTALVLIEDDFHLKPPLILAQLKDGDYFGEMAILDLKTNVRGASIIAESDLHLASLNIKDFQVVCSMYPEIQQIIQKFAIQRKNKNDRIMQSEQKSKKIKIIKQRKEEQEGQDNIMQEIPQLEDEEQENIIFKLKQSDEEKSNKFKSQTQTTKIAQSYYLQKIEQNSMKVNTDQIPYKNQINLDPSNDFNLKTNEQEDSVQLNNLKFNPRKSLIGSSMHNLKENNINYFDFQGESLDGCISPNNKGLAEQKEQIFSPQTSQVINFTNGQNSISKQKNLIQTNQMKPQPIQQIETNLYPKQSQLQKAKNDFVAYIRSQNKKNTHKSTFINTQPQIQEDNQSLTDDFNNLSVKMEQFNNVNNNTQQNQGNQSQEEGEIDKIFNEFINNNNPTPSNQQQLKMQHNQSMKIIDIVDGDEENLKDNEMIQQVENQSNQNKQNKKDDNSCYRTDQQSLNQQHEEQDIFSNNQIKNEKSQNSKPNKEINIESENEESYPSQQSQQEQYFSTPQIFIHSQEDHDTNNNILHEAITPADHEDFNLLRSNINFQNPNLNPNHLLQHHHYQIQQQNHFRNYKDNQNHHQLQILNQENYDYDKQTDYQKTTFIESNNHPNFQSKYFSFGENHKFQNNLQQLSQGKLNDLIDQDQLEVKSDINHINDIQKKQSQKFIVKRRSQSAEILLKQIDQLENVEDLKNKDKRKKQAFQSEKLKNGGNQIDMFKEGSQLIYDQQKYGSSISSEVIKSHYQSFTIRKSDLNFKTSSFILYSSIALHAMGNFMKNNFYILRRQSVIMLIVSIYSCIMIPLNLAYENYFSFNSNIPLLCIEILSTIILVVFAYQEYQRNKLKLLKIKRKKIKGNLIDIYDQFSAMKKMYQNKLLINLIIAIPFALLFDISRIDNFRSDLILIVLSLNRMICIYNINYAINYYDSKQQQFVELIKLINIILITNHLNACLWILIGKQEPDWNNCWFKRISNTQIDKNDQPDFDVSNLSLYINALGWAFQIMSHTAVGDSSAINTREEVYSCLVISLTILFTIHFFSSMSSLVKVLSSSLKRDFLMKYKLVVAFIKKMGLKQFKPFVEIYFSYSWESMLGLDENKFLNEFPNNLRSDVIEHMYSNLIKYSIFFNSGPRWRNEQIRLSVLRFLKFDIFMPNDLITVAGDICNEVFIIFEGQAESFNFELYKMITFIPGDFFGGILNQKPNRLRQPAYIKASKICKVGRISVGDFFNIASAFPEWYLKLEDIQNQRYEQQMQCLKYFNKLDDNKFEKRIIVHQNEEVEIQDEREKFKEKVIHFKHNETYEITDELVKEYQNLRINFQQYDDDVAVAQAEPNCESDPRKSSEAVEEQKISSNSKKYKKHKLSQINPESNVNNIDQIHDSPKKNKVRERKQDKSQKIDNQNNQNELKSSNLQSRIIKQKNSILQNIQTQLNSNLIIIKSTRKDKLQVINCPFIDSQAEEIQVADPLQFSFQTCQEDEIFFILASLRNVFNIVRKSNRKIRYFLHPTGDLKLILDYIYMIVISIYLLYLPITIGFFNSCNRSTVIIFETIYLVVSFLHIIIILKTPPYLNGSINPSQKLINKQYVSSYRIYYDIVTLIPINLLFFLFKYDHIITDMSYIGQIFYDLVRLFPLLHYKYLFHQFSQMDSSLRSFSSIFNVIKQIYFIFSAINIMTCIWYWVNIYGQQFSSDSWISRFNLDDSPMYIQYLYSIFFILNTLSSTGYPQMVITNDFERVAFIILILFGFTMFAGIFGLQINQQQSLDLKLHDLYISMDNYKTTVLNIIRTIYNLIETNNMPKGLRKRVDIYFTYITEANLNDIEEITKIKGMMPSMMYNSILYNQTKTNLNAFKIFKDLNNPYLVRVISQSLKQEIFLEGDYIVRKDEFGNQMFFLISGKVEVVSDNEIHVLKTINQGEFFGEISLFTENYKRIASVIAKTVVHVYSIKKQDIQPIFQTFPEFKNYIFQQASKRLKETRKAVEDQSLPKQLLNKQSIIDNNKKTKFQANQLMFPNLLINEQKEGQIKLNQNIPIPQITSTIVVTNNDQLNQNRVDSKANRKQKKDSSQKTIEGKKDNIIEKKKLSKLVYLRRQFEEDLEEYNEEVDQLIKNDKNNISDLEIDYPQAINEDNIAQLQQQGSLSNIFKIQKIEILSAPFKEQNDDDLFQQKSKNKTRNYQNLQQLNEFCDEEDNEEQSEMSEKQDLNEYQSRQVLNQLQQIKEIVSSNDFVQANEMDFYNIPDLQSRRRLEHQRKNERRLSRINLKKQIKLSKQSEMRLQWGMNLEYN